MLTVQNLTYYIGARPLYHNANLHLGERDRVGLIGRNGTGKSTLLRIIAGDIGNYQGQITLGKEDSLGYLHQDLLLHEEAGSIRQVVLNAMSEVRHLETQIEETLQQMEAQPENHELVQRLTDLQNRFNDMGGYSLEAESDRILRGLGFQQESLDKPLSEFSGGWRMRVMLARILIRKPSLLLLDEPTNHLDLPAIEWLEEYLRSYEGAMIVVTHDRRFLDAVTDKIAEVSGQKLTLYNGNYSDYEHQKAERREVEEKAYANQQAKIKETERFIERFRAKANKARQVQSRVKALEKMEKIELEDESPPDLNIRFQPSVHSGKEVVKFRNLSKSYPELTIFENTSGEVIRGKKIALIGANGKGKSTLLRIINNSEPYQGEVKMGHNVRMAFYAQHQLESLTLDNEILEELQQAGTGKTDKEIRNLLGCFLFQGEEVFKKIKVLSGGEKARVALAKTLAYDANFLLLDEPTNHLDYQTVQILIEALKDFPGTLLFVSHEREFIQEVANTVWYIEGHQLKEYPGTYSEYQQWQAQRQAEAEAAAAPPKAAPKTEAPPPKKQPKKTDKAQKQQQRKLEQAEKQVEQLETKVAELEEELADPALYKENFERWKTLNAEYETQQKALKKALAEWERLVD